MIAQRVQPLRIMNNKTIKRETKRRRRTTRKIKVEVDTLISTKAIVKKTLFN